MSPREGGGGEGVGRGVGWGGGWGWEGDVLEVTKNSEMKLYVVLYFTVPVSI